MEKGKWEVWPVLLKALLINPSWFPSAIFSPVVICILSILLFCMWVYMWESVSRDYPDLSWFLCAHPICTLMGTPHFLETSRFLPTSFSSNPRDDLILLLQLPRILFIFHGVSPEPFFRKTFRTCVAYPHLLELLLHSTS